MSVCNNIAFTYGDEMIDEAKDPLEDLDIYTEIPKFYRLNEKIFAEPIANNIEDTDLVADNELRITENHSTKKSAGKRNKYLIDVDSISPRHNCPQKNCNKTFRTVTLLRAHIRRVHHAEQNKYMCEHCAAGFTASYLLQRHLAVHSELKTECPLCGKMLSRRTNMSVHLRCHASTRPHACPQCQRAFVRRATLNTHLRFVHRTEELRCHRCDEKFLSRKLLMNHKSCRPK